jgi:hypothetical protein
MKKEIDPLKNFENYVTKTLVPTLESISKRWHNQPNDQELKLKRIESDIKTVVVNGAIVNNYKCSRNFRTS